MKKWLCFVVLVWGALGCEAQSPLAARLESEYYVAAYARHYNVPVRFVRAIVEQESGWRRCPVSPKGAAGLMQLMPQTATRLGVHDRCNISENVSGGVRYLAWLIRRFSGDLRLAAAAYLAGEEVIARRGLLYRNREVVAYVSRIRKSYQDQFVEGRGTLSTALRSKRIR
jgi:soluble lytic murein transglycosylase-like protein